MSLVLCWCYFLFGCGGGVVCDSECVVLCVSGCYLVDVGFEDMGIFIEVFDFFGEMLLVCMLLLEVI